MNCPLSFLIAPSPLLLELRRGEGRDGTGGVGEREREGRVKVGREGAKCYVTEERR